MSERDKSGYGERGGLRGPGRGDAPRSYTGKCDVRLSAEEDSMLNRLSETNGVTRSDVMRRALRDFWKFNSGEEE